MLLLNRKHGWAWDRKMYDCPTYAANIRTNSNNAAALFSLTLCAYSFFNLNLNIRALKWSFSAELTPIFPKDLLSFWASPCAAQQEYMVLDALCAVGSAVTEYKLIVPS